jgi:hypothetical protein
MFGTLAISRVALMPNEINTLVMLMPMASQEFVLNNLLIVRGDKKGKETSSRIHNPSFSS